jgi:hypothetical protein
VFGSSPTEEAMVTILSLETHVYISVAKVDGNVCGYVIGHERKHKYYIWMLGIFSILQNLGELRAF